MTESLALALAGGALGVLVAAVSLPLLTRLIPVTLPVAGAPAVDLPVLLFAALLTTLTGIGFGTFPALRACREAELGGTRQGVRSGGGRRERLRGGLVVAEVAAAVVLLVAAGLLLRALARVQATDPGFRPSGVLTLRTALPTPKYEKTERPSEPQVYLPYRQVEDGWLSFFTPKDLVIRAGVEPASLLPAVRRIVHTVDPEQPISDVRTLEEVVADETATRAVQVRVLAAFAILAILLAGIGICGLLSLAVSERAREIGIRMALGARAGEILGMVLRRGALLAAAGVIPGVALAYAAGRAMASLLAGLEPGDAATFLSAVVLCLLMTLLGSFWPALRAVRVDPIRVIRRE